MTVGDRLASRRWPVRTSHTTHGRSSLTVRKEASPPGGSSLGPVGFFSFAKAEPALQRRRLVASRVEP